MKQTDFMRAFLSLYDDMLAAYNRMSADNFRQEITRRCVEFREKHPGSATALTAMQMHFAARGK